MNGISSVHETESIQMEKDLTELKLQVIGRLPVPTSLFLLLLDQRTLESRKHRSFTQLDDWVLCRVRKKGNTAKNTEEVQDSCSKELMRLPSISFDTCWATLSPMKTNSTATFQGNNGFISVYEEGYDKVNLPWLVTSLGNYFTPLKRKLSLGNSQENVIPSDKKLKNDDRN
ncbi:hypothetical protein REPUB_Repub11eG0113900 [Reevesia pubescens]